jgi:dolichyl-phosphate-mannose--protein O-mannosyl transferase
MCCYLKFKIPFTIVLEDSIPPLAIKNIGLIHAISKKNYCGMNLCSCAMAVVTWAFIAY